MTKNLVLLLMLLIAAFSMSACNDNNNGGGFAGGQQTMGSNFTLLDANGHPIANTFWSVNGTGFTTFTAPQAHGALAFTDAEGDTCSDPSDSTPQVADGDAQQDGCTDSNGAVQIFCTPGTSMTLTIDDGAGNIDTRTIDCPAVGTTHTDVDFPDTNPTPTGIVLFETSPIGGSDIGNRSAADDFCAKSAPKLSQTDVRAFINYFSSDSIVDMPSNYGVPTDVAIRTFNNTLIANNWDDLLDGSIAASLSSGGIDGNRGYYWTGSTSSGDPSKGGNCKDWTDIKDFGVIGSASDTDGDWLSYDNDICENSYTVLCIAFNPEDL